MGKRVIKLPAIFYTFNFVASAKNEPVAHIRIKLLALEQIKRGKDWAEVADIFNVHEKTIKVWAKLFEAEGTAGFKVKPGRGRKSFLPNNKIPEFKQAIAELQTQRKGGRINVTDITKMAAERFNAVYKEKGMYDLLDRIDMVWISARSVHPSSNIIEQEAFKKTL